jgi:hypothetical protein
MPLCVLFGLTKSIREQFYLKIDLSAIVLFFLADDFDLLNQKKSKSD